MEGVAGWEEGRERSDEERHTCEFDSPLYYLLLVTVDRILEKFRNFIAPGASGDPTPPLPLFPS